MLRLHPDFLTPGSIYKTRAREWRVERERATGNDTRIALGRGWHVCRIGGGAPLFPAYRGRGADRRRDPTGCSGSAPPGIIRRVGWACCRRRGGSVVLRTRTALVFPR